MVLYTRLKSRLTKIKSNSDISYNWIFLPGGPGLGSEYLITVTDHVSLPGTIWHLDLPNDGSNIIYDGIDYFQYWHAALIEAIQLLDKVILVAHSTGGMYALATPQLKHILHGIIIMDSAPDALWQHSFMKYVESNPLPRVQALQKKYEVFPSNELLKQLTIASIPYLTCNQERIKNFNFLEMLPYN